VLSYCVCIDSWQDAVVLSNDASSVTTNVGQVEFNRMFAECPVVQYTRNGGVHSVYARKSAIPANFDAYAIFTDTWGSSNNNLGTDFQIYDNVGDARLGTGAWSYCNYDDSDVAYPRDCGKSSYVGGQWFSMPGGRLNAMGVSGGVQFSIYTGDDCPAAGL
jgi:hypothetical protein